MKTLITVFLVIALFGSITRSKAQDKMSIEFGTITPQDFEVKPPSTDLYANAIVVADWGNSDFSSDISKDEIALWGGGMGYSYNKANVLEFSRKTRIKIVNKRGFDAATVSIRLNITDAFPEKLVNLIAYTYNLINGKVIKSKVSNRSITTWKESENWVVKKFTFPSLKEGSLVEYSYTIQSTLFSNFHPWFFQGNFPCLWSEYNVCIPDFLTYQIAAHKEQFYFISNTGRTQYHNGDGNNHVSRPDGIRNTFEEHFKLLGQYYRWVMKNVAALEIDSSAKRVESIYSMEFKLVPVIINGNINSLKFKPSDSIYKAMILKKINIPTTFSPNGDGFNDKWVIRGLSEYYPYAIVKVYRAGMQLVFESTGYMKAWDGKFHGKPMPVGSYNYSILVDKTNPEISGSVTLTK